MEDRDLLARIDRQMERTNLHMERGNRHMERGNRHMERGNQLMAEIREEVRLSRASAEAALERYDELQSDLRGFIRETVTRMDRSLRQQRDEIRDLREESRAHTSALLRMLDRLDGPGGSSATA